MAWVVRAFGAVFLLLAVLFLARPRGGAALFGVGAEGEGGLAYVRAVGLRDLALGLYLLGLVQFASLRAAGVVLVATVVIPLGDMLLVVFGGDGSPGHLLLHGASAVCVGALGFWLLLRK